MDINLRVFGMALKTRFRSISEIPKSRSLSNDLWLQREQIDRLGESWSAMLFSQSTIERVKITEQCTSFPARLVTERASSGPATKRLDRAAIRRARSSLGAISTL